MIVAIAIVILVVVLLFVAGMNNVGDTITLNPTNVLATAVAKADIDARDSACIDRVLSNVSMLQDACIEKAATTPIVVGLF